MNFVVHNYIIIVIDVVWLELCANIVMMPTIFGLFTFFCYCFLTNCLLECSSSMRVLLIMTYCN